MAVLEKIQYIFIHRLGTLCVSGDDFEYVSLFDANFIFFNCFISLCCDHLVLLLGTFVEGWGWGRVLLKRDNVKINRRVNVRSRTVKLTVKGKPAGVG